MRHLLIILLAIIIGAAAGLGFYAQRYLYSPASNSSAEHIFTITSGTSSPQIAQELQRQELIRSPFLFLAYTKYHKDHPIPTLCLVQINISTLPPIYVWLCPEKMAVILYCSLE